MAVWGTSEAATDSAQPRAAPVDPTDRIPPSAIPVADGLMGLAGLVAAWAVVMLLQPPTIVGAWVVVLATAVPMLRLELRRAAPSLSAREPVSALTWVLGFILATVPFALVHGQGMGFEYWLIAWVVALPAFTLRLLLEARRNGALSSGFPAMLGRTLLRLDRGALRGLAPAARLWGLKAFFIPLYALSLFALVGLALTADLNSPVGWLGLAVLFAYTIDLSFGLSGYLFASNDLAPTVRSTQPRLLGWIVCIACYGPVIMHWPAFEAVVRQEIAWPATLTASPLVLAGAAALLALLVLYVWASVSFGLRFSNLSNRGLVAHGPYRWMKHPAYFAHASNAWILCLVLIPAAGVDLGLSQWLVPVAFTILYRLRSVTEEHHMSEDPAYRDYAAWIARHGALALIKRMVVGR
jgi:isoprenylcysteine carboxyl methyltransferase (ICMT) family protein YpbQ